MSNADGEGHPPPDWRPPARVGTAVPAPAPVPAAPPGPPPPPPRLSRTPPDIQPSRPPRHSTPPSSTAPPRPPWCGSSRPREGRWCGRPGSSCWPSSCRPSWRAVVALAQHVNGVGPVTRFPVLLQHNPVGNLIIGILAYLPVAAMVPLALHLLVRTGQPPRALGLVRPTLRLDVWPALGLIGASFGSEIVLILVLTPLLTQPPLAREQHGRRERARRTTWSTASPSPPPPRSPRRCWSTATSWSGSNSWAGHRGGR